MANFKTHISFGVIVGVTLALFITFFSLTKSLLVAFIAFSCVIFGSFLPDIDVDTGTPFQIIFGILSLGIGMLSFFYLKSLNIESIKFLIGIPLFAIFFIRFILGMIFKKFTAHRGIWHSIPFLLIAMLSTLQIVNLFNFRNIDKAILSISVGLGYLSHLILDEIFSLVNIGGFPFKVKRSLGSALKLVSHSKSATLFAYLILVILIIFSYPILIDIVKDFK